MNPNSFRVVEDFEDKVAKLAGAPYAVATSTGTAALFLSMKYAVPDRARIVMPAHTFVSVPMAALQCGLKVEFEEVAWEGVYQLKPWPIWDGALRFREGMYQGGLHCLSFHARKLLNIGEGGMILCEDEEAADWLRAARYSGRRAPRYAVEDIDMIGWQYYMTPEKAARGLHLLDYIPGNLPDQKITYPDLRKVKVFQDHAATPE